MLDQVFRDRARRLVRPIPRLLGQHRFAVELFVQLALDDLLADVLRLREDFFRVGEDLALGVNQLLRHLVPRSVGGACEREVQRKAAGRRGVSALRANECADLVRRAVHVVRQRLAVARLHPLGSGDLDVLAQPRGELDAPWLELRGAPRRRRTRRQHLLGKRAELLVLRDGLGLAADRDDRPTFSCTRSRPALGRLATGTLRRRRHAFLAQQLDGFVEVAVRLLERALAVHHPRARRIAELLHHRGGDLGHCALLLGARRLGGGPLGGAALRSPARSTSGSAAAAAAAASALGLLRGASAARGSLGAASRRLAGSAARHLVRGHLLLAGLDAVGDRLTTSEHERIASSLPGMT